MPDPNPDVAAVLAEALGATTTGEVGGEPLTDVYRPEGLARIALAALTKAGYAVVKLPEGVAMAHGARLVEALPGDFYFEPPSEAP